MIAAKGTDSASKEGKIRSKPGKSKIKAHNIIKGRSLAPQVQLAGQGPVIGQGFFNSLHAGGKMKFCMDIGNPYKLKFSPKTEPGLQVFTALVLNFI